MDGYEAYARFVEKDKSVVHVLCWAHTRRKFIEAEKLHPEEVGTALSIIRDLYEIEPSLEGKSETEMLEIRSSESREVVGEFFDWAEELLRSKELDVLLDRAGSEDRRKDTIGTFDLQVPSG